MADAKIKLRPLRIEVTSNSVINILTLNDSKVRAMALWPFVLFRHQDFKDIDVILNHELIHHRQQLEMAILPFYFFYFINYWYNRIKYKKHFIAYMNVVFEKEAYAYEKDLKYLKNRKFWSWKNFL
jgi:hypothetical protein